jgi:hypothetical protein
MRLEKWSVESFIGEEFFSSANTAALGMKTWKYLKVAKHSAEHMEIVLAK